MQGLGEQKHIIADNGQNTLGFRVRRGSNVEQENKTNGMQYYNQK